MAAAPFAVCADGLSFSGQSFSSEKSDLLSVKWTDAPESTIHSIREDNDLELSLQSAQCET